MGAKTSKRFFSLESPLNPFKPFLNFLLSGPDESTVFDFLKVEFLIFQDFFFVFVNMGPHGSQNFNCYSSLKLLLKLINLFLNFLLSCPRKSTVWILEIFEFPIFIFFFYFTIVPYGETEKHQLSGKRATVERNGVKFGPRGVCIQCKQGTFDA